MPPASEAREEYVPAYYPAATTAAGAIPLEVAAGAQMRGVDMVLRKAPTVRTKGRVVVELSATQGSPSVNFSAQIGHDNSAAGVWRYHAAKSTRPVNPTGERLV